MSKRHQTENFRFRVFSNTPMNQAATDFSENWRELDGHLQNLVDNDRRIETELNTRIDEEITARELGDTSLSDRIDELKGIVDDLSPESIEDFKTRLNAVEHKVATNSGLIALIQQKDNEQDTLLQNHEERLTALENGLTALEVKHDSDMAAVNEHLTALDDEQLLQNDRLTHLEGCCEVATHEIADLQSHVEAINDELVTVTNQVEVLTGIVTDVKMEIDKKQPIELMQPIVMDGVTYTTVESLLAALASRQPAPPTPTGQYYMDGEELNVNRPGFQYIPPDELNIYGSGDFGVTGGNLHLAETDTP